ncbi:hypothetical protein RIF29_30175 [Crotalaria pallida]|uniref:Uncharacterized protein n=1 Tax=Crotalaria pallida TaxID=3830 RepID=A0AAN9HWJ1_CROPI
MYIYTHKTVAVICPLIVDEGEILDGQNKRVATIFDVSSLDELERLRPGDAQAENIVVNFIDWQALEHGLDGIILKVEDVEPVLELKKNRKKQYSELDQSHCDTCASGWNGGSCLCRSLQSYESW